MYDENLIGTPNLTQDYKAIDFGASVLTGLSMWWMQLPSAPYLDATYMFELRELGRLAVKVGAFAFVSLSLSLWKHRLRIDWGWILVGISGVILTSIFDEIIYRATSTPHELAFMPAFSPFPFEIVVFFWPALLMMATAHYLGLLILQKGQQYP